MTLNLATASQLAGDYAESDKVCATFLDKHKESTLLPSVLMLEAPSLIARRSLMTRFSAITVWPSHFSRATSGS